MEQNMNPIPPGAGGSYQYQEQIHPQPAPDPHPDRRTGFAIASLVLGIVSMCGCCLCCIHFITAPLAIIFGTISLVRHCDGKGLSLTGIILAVLSVIMTVALLISLRPILKHMDVISDDMVKLIEEQDEVFPAYEKDGELPDYLRKYLEDPYDEMLRGYDITIYDVMDTLLVEYKNGRLRRMDFIAGSTAAPDHTESSGTTVSLPDSTGALLCLPLPGTA